MSVKRVVNVDLSFRNPPPAWMVESFGKIESLPCHSMNNGKGCKVFAICETCGLYKWIETHGELTEPESVLLVPASSCNRCDDIHRRSPEIYEWLICAREYGLKDGKL